MTRSRFKSTWLWFAEAKFVVLALGISVAALLVSLRPGTPEPTVRLTGLVLQILGICTVLWSVSETRALFAHPPVLRKLIDWLGRFPLVRRSRAIAVGASTVAAVGAKASGHITHGPGRNPTIESRLDALEKNMGAIHGRITGLQRDTDTEIGNLRQSVKQEAETRANEHEELRDKIEATGTGSIHISVIGVVWLLVGVILSTAAPEIASLLN